MISPGKISGYLSGVINSIIDTQKTQRPLPSATVRTTETPHGTVIEVPALMDTAEFYPFKLSVGGKDIRVEQGRWDRNGSVAPNLTLAVDAGKTYKTISSPVGGGAFANSTTYIVYVALERTTGNLSPELAPDTINVYADTALPTDSPITANLYRQLGTVYCDADGFLNQPDQDWYGGHIDDTALMPDGASAYNNVDSAIGYQYQSLEVSTFRSDKHYRDLQIWGWDNPDTSVVIDNSDLFMFQDVSDVNLPVKYVSGEGLADYISSVLNLTWSPTDDFWEQHALENHNDWDGILNPTTALKDTGRIPVCLNSSVWAWTDGGDITGIKHKNLDFATGTIPATAYLNTDHDYRYPEPDTPANGTDANAGIFTFTNATAASSSAGAIYLPSGGIGAANAWFDDGARSASFTDGTRAGLLSDDTRSADLVNETDDHAAKFVNGAKVVYIGGTDAVYAYGNIKIDGTSGDYYHNSNQGQTIANWTSGGILHGGSIIEIDADDLQATDKLLVYRP